MKSEIDRLTALPLAQLRDEWHRWHPDRLMPERLPRDLLVRMIAWRMQEQASCSEINKLTRTLARMSDQLSRTGSLDLEREVRLKPGTRLLREWHGHTYRVTALEQSWLYDGKQFASLSEIAREITGTRWSGPRFFGLKPASFPSVRSESGNV